jgi:hypothetical protein
MAISLYEASIATYLQTLGAVSSFLDKGLSHCRENGIDPEEIVETRLFPDMHPFHFQIQQVVLHSVGAVEAIKSGSFKRPGERPQHDYPALQALVVDARNGLQKLAPEEIDRREGTEVVMETRDSKRVFTAEGFLLSFSLPNFYFHAATAYDILRTKGVPVGKRDFMGALRLKE